MSETPRLLTLAQFAEVHRAFTVGSLRWLRFRTRRTRLTRKNQEGEAFLRDLPPNGFASAFKTVGNRILIDEREFFRIVEEQNACRPDAGGPEAR